MATAAEKHALITRDLQRSSMGISSGLFSTPARLQSATGVSPLNLVDRQMQPTHVHIQALHAPGDVRHGLTSVS